MNIIKTKQDTLLAFVYIPNKATRVTIMDNGVDKHRIVWKTKKGWSQAEIGPYSAGIRIGVLEDMRAKDCKDLVDKSRIMAGYTDYMGPRNKLFTRLNAKQSLESAARKSGITNLANITVFKLS